MGLSIGQHGKEEEVQASSSNALLLMTDDRYRELLSAGPRMSMEDVERLKDLEPVPTTMFIALLQAYPVTKVNKRDAKRYK
jgi:hypothetical protein